MSAEILLSFKQDVSLINQAESDQLMLVSWERQLTFKNAQPGLIYAIESLKTSEFTAAQLKQFVLDKDGFEASLKFVHHLKKLINFGWIRHSLVIDGKIATSIPVTANYEFPQSTVAPDGKYILSRFANCHQNQGIITLKSSYSSAEIVLDWRGGALISLLSIPQTVEQLSDQIPGISQAVIEPFLNLLLGHGMLAEVQADGEIIETFTKDNKRKGANDYKWLIPRYHSYNPTETEKLAWDEIHKDYEKHCFSVTPDPKLCEAIIHSSVRVPNFDIPNSAARRAVAPWQVHAQFPMWQPLDQRTQRAQWRGSWLARHTPPTIRAQCQPRGLHPAQHCPRARTPTDWDSWRNWRRANPPDIFHSSARLRACQGPQSRS